MTETHSLVDHLDILDVLDEVGLIIEYGSDGSVRVEVLDLLTLQAVQL